jgi:hypothetical protein
VSDGETPYSYLWEIVSVSRGSWSFSAATSASTDINGSGSGTTSAIVSLKCTITDHTGATLVKTASHTFS